MRLLLALIACLAVVLAACGGDDDADVTPTAVVTETAAVSETPSPSPTLPPLLTPGPVQATGAQSLESTVITFQTAFGDTGLNTEIADDPEERHIGLMFRESLGEDFGMLFIWPEDTNSGFWMQNTLVPLSIAFVKADGTVIEIEEMEPETTELHSSPEPFRYAIEANIEWFEENGVKVGDTVDLGSAQR